VGAASGHVNSPAERVPHLPGSRYAAELNRGAGDMRFPPELEREYHHFYLSERRSHVRSFNVIMCVLFVLACADSVWTAPFQAQLAQHLRLGAIAFAYLAMAAVAYSRHYQRFYLETARYACIVISVVGAVEVAHRIHAGAGEVFALLTPYSIGLYFLAGILYRAALQANIVMISAFAATLIYLREPPARTAELIAILAATALIGGLAFRHQGIRFRRTFLERGLIGEMAARDGLTGLKNRRAFDEHLTRTWQQALRDRRQLALMMIDVDHFKKFNDRYGHQAGDEALQRIAAVVDSFAKRPLDLAARYGGEELAVILFDVSREHAERFAEQLRAGVQNLRIPHIDHAPGVATVSVGVAVVHPTLERSPDGALQLADEAMYAAKRDGRNSVRTFESEYQGLSTGTFRAQ
jgi:diguanylate cyclase (GGDEF)-like protein